VSELSKYWNIAPTGVLHVGAHLGEEASDYEKNFKKEIALPIIQTSLSWQL
jgi:hypothetical protein